MTTSDDTPTLSPDEELALVALAHQFRANLVKTSYDPKVKKALAQMTDEGLKQIWLAGIYLSRTVAAERKKRGLSH